MDKDRLCEIIKEQERILGMVWRSEDRNDLSLLKTYHDTLEIISLTPVECMAVLRGVFRVRHIYPNWFDLRSQIIEHLSKDPCLPLRQMMHGLMTD